MSSSGASLSDLKKLMETGEVKFKQNALVISQQCFGTSFGVEFTETTGVSFIGGSGHIIPITSSDGKTDSNRFAFDNSDSGVFTKFNKLPKTNDEKYCSLKSQVIGKVLDPSTEFKKNSKANDK